MTASVAANRQYQYRKLKSNLMMGVTVAATVVTLAPLFLVLGYLLLKGASSLNLDFFVHLPKPVGQSGGGMANAIVGTLQIVGIACLVGVPIGIGAGLYLAEHRGSQLANAVRFAADVMMGVPSIVVGIFAYAVVVKPMRSFSALAGGFALGVMLVPIVLRSTEEFLRAVPTSLREGALALGAKKWRSIATVVIPAAYKGIATGILLSLARVAGETAPLIFTSFGNPYWSRGFNEPTSSLPVMIYTYALSAYDDWHRQAWAAGLVLLAFVLVANVGAKLILSRGMSSARG